MNEINELKQQLETERAARKAAEAKISKIHFKVSNKGAVSVYGLQRFPVTLYAQQWERLIPEIPALCQFLQEHEKELARK